MLKKLWIFQPDEIVSLGRYKKAITDANIPYQLLQLWDNPPLPKLNPKAEALIILGGRPNALDSENFPWLKELYQKLPGWVEAGLPVLGICLGHQILAHALGGKLSLQDKHGGEDGPCLISLATASLTDPIFTPAISTALGQELDKTSSVIADSKSTTREAIVYQSHHDIVAVLPPGAILLASSANCKNQAFRYQNSWSVQFHPETTADIMQAWAKGENTDAQAMYRRCQKVDKEVGEFGLKILENFLAFTTQR